MKTTSELMANYTIPKIKRELKQCHFFMLLFLNYTIPKIKRELKQQVEYI